MPKPSSLVMAIAFLLSLAPNAWDDIMSPLGASGLTQPSSQPKEAGYRYHLHIEQRAVDSRGRIRDEPHFGGIARTRGVLVRVDFDSITARQQRANWYVTRDAGRNVTFVDERQRMVAELPVATLGDRVQQERRMSLRLSALRLDWGPERPCGAIGTWMTRCITLAVRYRSHSRLSLVRDVIDVEETLEYRFIPELDDLVLPFESFYATRLDLLAHRDPEFATRWRAAQQGRPSGSVVRLTVRRTESQGQRRNTIRRVISIDSLERSIYDAALFDVPPGFRLAPR